MRNPKHRRKGSGVRSGSKGDPRSTSLSRQSRAIHEFVIWHDVSRFANSSRPLARGKGGRR